MRIIDHLPLDAVAHDGRSAEPLENADLDFLRAQGNEPVKARSETLDRFARQADDQIRMDVNARFATQEAKVFLQPCVVLPSFDQGADFLVEGLHAHLKLQRTGRKLCDDLPEFGWQPVGY